MRRRWVPALAALALLSTTVLAAAVLVGGHRAAGLTADWPRALLWQGLVYGSWVPVGLALSRLVERLGLTGRLVLVLYGLGLPVTLAHAVFVTALDIAFSPRAERGDWSSLLISRAPIDMLVYVALATFVAALGAYRRAAVAAEEAARLGEALQAARRSLEQPAEPTSEPPLRLLVSAGSKRVVVDPGEVEWFASAGNYVVVNWRGREGLIRETLTALEQRLDPAAFARSHRSTIVNLARVRDAVSLSDGSWRLTTESGAELVVSRTYRDAVLSRLGS